MSVYTPLDPAQLQQVLTDFNYRLRDHKAASHGIENSTFLLTAENGDGQPRGLVLTLFEQLQATELAPYLEVLTALAARQLPVPAPLTNVHGESLLTVAGKPAVMMPRLPGDHVFSPVPAQLQAIGTLLARLHRTPVQTLPALPGERQRLSALAAQLPQVPQQQQRRARAVLARWQEVAPTNTLIHADLFRDNVLWQGQTLTGVLDFYNACLDVPEYDLAVTLNDWCVDNAGQPLPERERTLLHAYRQAGGRYDAARLRLALAVAALRFWLSRLAGPVAEESEGVGSKDPQEFARIFARRSRDLDAAPR